MSAMDGTVGCLWQPSGFAGGNYDGGPIRVKAKYSIYILYRAREAFFLKAASIQETPATEINKKHLPPAKCTILMPRTVTKNARKCPSKLDRAVFGVIGGV